MIALNLEAKTKEQELIKAYLEQNVSEILAEKINAGVTVKKDGKRLLNRKTLDSFMSYALEEAKKQAVKGARGACIEDRTVFGWAVHYFEEDSIEGTLYNEDGTEYKPKPKFDPKTTSKPSDPAKVKPSEQTLFDFMDYESAKEDLPEETVTLPTAEIETISDPDDDDDQPTKEEIRELLRELAEQEAQENADAHERKPAVIENSDEIGLPPSDEPDLTYAVDPETGEILTETEMRKFDGDIEEPHDLRTDRTVADSSIVRELSDLIGDVIIVR